jgi:predicted permease
MLFLAIDEASSIHEQLTVVTREALGTSGYLFFAWVIPYGVATLLLILLFAKFLFDLPVRTRSLFVLAGAIYVTGALGFEMLGGRYVTSPGATEVVYSVIYTMEELFEMTGIALFIYAILHYMTAEFSRLAYVISEQV